MGAGIFMITFLFLEENSSPYLVHGNVSKVLKGHLKICFSTFRRRKRFIAVHQVPGFLPPPNEFGDGTVKWVASVCMSGCM